MSDSDDTQMRSDNGIWQCLPSQCMVWSDEVLFPSLRVSETEARQEMCCLWMLGRQMVCDGDVLLEAYDREGRA